MWTLQILAFMFSLILTNYKSPETVESLTTPNPTSTPTQITESVPEITAQPTPSATATPTTTSSPTPAPTLTPAPTVQPTPNPTSTPTPAPTSAPQKTVSSKNDILSQINEYRANHGLAPASEESTVCSFASLRASELANNFSHQGFRGRIDSNSLPYSNYSEVTENIAMTTNPSEVVKLWINSPGHAENMRKDTPYICVRNSGNYYAFEGWRP